MHFARIGVLLSISRLVTSFTRTSFVRYSSSLHVKVGDSIPDVTLFEGQPEYNKANEVNLKALCAGKTVVLFAVPGAFTPG